MALRRSAKARTLAASLWLAVVAGCAAGAPPKASDPNPPATGGKRAIAEIEAIERECPDARPWSTDGNQTLWWESFRRTKAALVDEIDRRAEALRTGPIGNRGKELASLRLAASAHDLLEAGSKTGASEALERAVSLDAGNGYAWLWLAYVTPGLEADALADKAERTLPKDAGVRCELAGLRVLLRHDVCTGYGGDHENSRN